MTALVKVGENPIDDTVIDVYRGLATEDEAHPDLFYYDIVTSPTASIDSETKIASTDGLQVASTTTPGTAKITGINYINVFKDAFGEDPERMA